MLRAAVLDRVEPSARPEVVHHLLTSAPGGATVPVIVVMAVFR